MVGFQPSDLARIATIVPVVNEKTLKILDGFDPVKVKVSIKETFLEEAYYLLLDAWRVGSERLGDAI